MPENDNSDFVSIIYNQKNDSPKYFRIKKYIIIIYFIGLPTITLISLVLGGIGLVHTSPFHLLESYEQNSRAREAISKTDDLMNQINIDIEEKETLTKKLAEAKAEAEAAKPLEEIAANNTLPSSANSIGLSNLSFFRPIPGQKDLSHPATLNLSGFNIVQNRDNIDLQFNIIPNSVSKLSGHIIVLMKNELTIQVYPSQAFIGKDTQINFSSGEPFATQRFRPVVANFLRPRKAGNYIFSVYIFAKNGDLIHFQSITMPVKF